MLFNLFQLDPVRFIQVYIVQGIVGLIFLYLAYKILRRDTKRLNLIFSIFYISIAVGIFMNFVYAPLTDETIVFILNFLTNYFLFLSPIFLLVFNLILLKSTKVFNTKKQLILISVYAVALFCMILIPGGVTINASTGWKPVWSVPLFIYVIIVMNGMAGIPGFVIAGLIYKKFEDEQLKKKWKYFLIGLAGIFIFADGTILSNTLNIQDFRTVWSLISLGLSTISPYLMYFGVGREIEK